MPKFRVTSPDGKTFEVDAPDGSSQQDALAYVQKQQSQMSAKPVPGGNNVIGAEGGGRVDAAWKGLTDPFVGGAQLLTHAAGAAADALGIPDTGFVKSQDDYYAARERQYQSDRAVQGREGFDALRLTGNAGNPINWLGGAPKLVAGAIKPTMTALATMGAKTGALAGATAPVNDTSDGYWGQKARDVTVGAGAGAVLTPVAGKALGGAADLAVNLKNRLLPQSADNVAEDLAFSIRGLADQMQSKGLDLTDIPKPIFDRIQKDVETALRQGGDANPAEILRRVDFESLGIKPTRGQVSRDPTEFTNERNLSHTEGGKLLKNRFAEQSDQLRSHITGLSSDTPIESTTAGNRLSEIINAADKPGKKAVSDAYDAARDSSGRSANIDVPAFSQTANAALDEQMLGHMLPEKARNLLNDVSSGKLPFSVNNAVQMDKVLSTMQRRATDEEKMAIGVVRTALNTAPIESTAGVETKAAFDAARGLAKDRFAKIERNPMADAALAGDDPAKFVEKYVIGGTPRTLSNLAQDFPETRDLARSQIVEHLRTKGFGTDAAGDVAMAQDSFNKALKSIGRERLQHFFSPEEVNKLFTVGRVSANVTARPAGEAVNNSKTAGAAMNLLGSLATKVPLADKIPGLNVITMSLDAAKNARDVSRALTPAMQAELEGMPPELRNRLMLLITSGSAGTSGTGAREIQ